MSGRLGGQDDCGLATETVDGKLAGSWQQRVVLGPAGRLRAGLSGLSRYATAISPSLDPSLRVSRPHLSSAPRPLHVLYVVYSLDDDAGSIMKPQPYGRYSVVPASWCPRAPVRIMHVTSAARACMTTWPRQPTVSPCTRPNSFSGMRLFKRTRRTWSSSVPFKQSRRAVSEDQHAQRPTLERTPTDALTIWHDEAATDAFAD